MIDINSLKTPTIMKSQESLPTDAIVFAHNGIYRYPTIRECELMQTLPEGYVNNVPDIQYRIKTGVIGNSWTVDVVKAILEKMEI